MTCINRPGKAVRLVCALVAAFALLVADATMVRATAMPGSCTSMAIIGVRSGSSLREAHAMVAMSSGRGQGHRHGDEPATALGAKLMCCAAACCLAVSPALPFAQQVAAGRRLAPIRISVPEGFHPRDPDKPPRAVAALQVEQETPISWAI